MRIALTKGTLKLPPTYFALSHAESLQAEHEFRMFTLVAQIDDPNVTVPVQQAVPHRRWPSNRLSFDARARISRAFQRALTRQIAHYRPDLIHQHFATGSLPAVNAALSLGAPLVTTVHGADVAVLLRHPDTATARRHLRNVAGAQSSSARVLAVSEYLAGRAVAAGFDPSRLEVHYQGVDADYFTPAGTEECDPAAETEPPIVVFVGALSELKGVRDLLLASAGLIATVPHRLVLIGQGPLDEEVRAAVRDHSHVTMTGWLDRATVRDWMRRSHVLVLPTQEYRGQREAAGLVLLEAQSCGTPVVAYDTGGTTEMFQADVTGLAVPEKDTDGLQSAIAQVLSMPTSEYEKLRGAAREFVLAERSLALSCVQLVEHYRDVTG